MPDLVFGNRTDGTGSLKISGVVACVHLVRFIFCYEGSLVKGIETRAILDTKHSLVASSRKIFGVSSRGRNRRKLNSTSYFRNSHDFPCNSFALLSVSLARIVANLWAKNYKIRTMNLATMKYTIFDLYSRSITDKNTDFFDQFSIN